MNSGLPQLPRASTHADPPVKSPDHLAQSIAIFPSDSRSSRLPQHDSSLCDSHDTPQDLLLKHVAKESNCSPFDVRYQHEHESAVSSNSGPSTEVTGCSVGDAQCHRASDTTEDIIQGFAPSRLANESWQMNVGTGLSGTVATHMLDRKLGKEFNDSEMCVPDEANGTASGYTQTGTSDQNDTPALGDIPQKYLRRVGSIKEGERAPTPQYSRGGTSPLHGKSTKEKDKKSMLSQALQRANVAVAMDNAQNYEAAVSAYDEACEFLGRVMSRSSNEEDRRKLRAIRSTYLTRIEELQRINSQSRPLTEFMPDNRLKGFSDVPEIHAQTSEDVGRLSLMLSPSSTNQSFEERLGSDLRGVSQSVPVVVNSIPPYRGHPSLNDQHSRMEERYKLSKESNVAPHSVNIAAPPSQYRTAHSSAMKSSKSVSGGGLHHVAMAEDDAGQATISVHNSANTTHLGVQPSPSSSSRSLPSGGRLQGGQLRNETAHTEADFDAALDAAVEAAYGDGLEPQTDGNVGVSVNIPGISLRKTIPVNTPLHGYNSFARQDAAIPATKEQTANRGLNSLPQSVESMSVSDLDTDEEERVLEEVTREFMLDNHVFDEQAKSALPRQFQEDSVMEESYAEAKTIKGKWLHNTSPLSSGTCATSVLAQSHTVPSQTLPPPTAPPTTALPQLPTKTDKSAPGVAQIASVQDRRFSGHKVKRLQIKTAIDSKLGTHVGTQPLTGQPELQDETPITASSTISARSEAIHSKPILSDEPSFGLLPSIHGANMAIDVPNLQPDMKESILASHLPYSLSSDALGPTTSSGTMTAPSSLPNSSMSYFDNRTVSVQHPSSQLLGSSSYNEEQHPSSHDAEEMRSPSQSPFGVPQPTSHSVGSMSEAANPANDMQLFANELYTKRSPPGEPSGDTQAPQQLEPCPTSTLLRPFWLLRCVHQTLSHPRGGYITTRLFIPREAWKMKNVRLKCVEDKIAACELLTPALLKLGAVNTFDADAVLEEMQALEAIMDEAQVNLTKKLGNDVGVNNISSLFKEAPPQPTVTTLERQDSMVSSFGADTSGPASTTGSFGKTTGKVSYLSSWRKLRSKSSNNSLTQSVSFAKEIPKEVITMSTLPMTANDTAGRNTRRTKRVDGSAQDHTIPVDARTMGPNVGYMGALIRLCGAVQVLDDIARQVEDPGLQKSSPTYVGLELSARHASEFFGFFFCRFVLQDLMLLAEKFVVRASEWVTL